MAYDLIPQPKTFDVTRGGFRADMRATITASISGETAAGHLAEAVFAKTSFLLAVDFRKLSGHVLWVSLDAQPKAEIARAKKALAKAGDSPEAYGLVVTAAGIAAAANSPAGLLYAAATLAQLVESADGKPFWPACVISDWPDLDFRAVHVDLKYHMDKLDYLGELVPRLASFKVNALVLELENKFLYRRRPEISAPLGFSPDELQELTGCCMEYGIELVPLVQGLGHVSYILRHPKYARLREKADSFAEFCPQQQGTYDVLFDLYEEVAEATEGSKYFHIGGDEAWLMGHCPRCSKALKTNLKFSLYEIWLNRCADKVRALGRVPMVWDDMLIHNAGDDWSALPKDLFYVRWNYRPDAAATNRDLVERYASSGLKVIVAAAIQTAGPYVPNYMREHLPNIDGWAKAAARAGLSGILTTAWEDSGNHTETFWPGYAATGAAGWNSSTDIDFEFLVKFTRVFHSAPDGKIAAVYRTLADAAGPTFSLFAQFDPYKADQMHPLPALVPAEPGKRWRDANADRIAAATVLAAQLREAKKVLSAEILSGRRENPYALEVLLAAARIMLARVDLFFAVRDSEIAIEDAYAAFKAHRGDRASDILHGASVVIWGALGAAESALSSLEAVWELTRFPQDMSLFESPKDRYVHDYNNYGHLACKTTDLSYIIYIERRIGAREMAARLMRASEEVKAGNTWPLGQ